jgi:hypothetical protein
MRNKTLKNVSENELGQILDTALDDDDEDEDCHGK